MITLNFRGLDAVKRAFKRDQETALRALQLAVNAAARYAAREGSKGIRSEVNFKRTYIGDASRPGSRLRITKTANRGDLTAVISAQDRATSLARFATGTPTFGRRKGKRPVRVKVGADAGSKKMPGAFFVRLNKGASFTEDQYNLGLVVRTKSGKLKNKNFGASQFGKSGNLFLVHGPSVAQVFEGVSADISDDVADFAVTEFLRQQSRLARG